MNNKYGDGAGAPKVSSRMDVYTSGGQFETGLEGVTDSEAAPDDKPETISRILYGDTCESIDDSGSAERLGYSAEDFTPCEDCDGFCLDRCEGDSPEDDTEAEINRLLKDFGYA